MWNDNKHKKRQKDIDARWTKKNNETFYGYKNHAKVDNKSKILTKFIVTPASVHDSQALVKLLDEPNEANEPIFGDSAYTGAEPEKVIENSGMVNEVCSKGYRNNPLTTKQKQDNRKKSKIRSRVEHVFGFMEQSMQGLCVRSIGIIRATGIIGLINLTYNIFRYA